MVLKSRCNSEGLIFAALVRDPRRNLVQERVNVERVEVQDFRPFVKGHL